MDYGVICGPESGFRSDLSAGFGGQPLLGSRAAAAGLLWGLCCGLAGDEVWVPLAQLAGLDPQGYGVWSAQQTLG